MEQFVNRFDLCCGVPLKRATKCIAMIDLVNSIGTGVFVAFIMVITLFYGDDIKIALDKDRAEFPDEAGVYDYMGTGFIMWVLFLTLVTSILYFFLAQNLLYGAQQKDVFKVTRWIHITLVLLCLRLVGLLFATIMASDSTGMLFFGILYLFYTVYCLLVVYKFRNELLTDEGLGLTQSQHPVYKVENMTI